MKHKQIIVISLLFFVFNCRNALKFINGNQYKLAWEENFNNALDLNFWNIEIRDAGWVNNEMQAYTSSSSNLFIKDNKLFIRALKENYNNAKYTSARITTQKKVNWMYGYFEIRAKFDQMQGTWPAIWLLSESIDKEGWPECGEIDIMEHINTENKVYGSLHSEKYNHMKGNNLGGNNTIGNALDNFKSSDLIIDWIKVYK